MLGWYPSAAHWSSQAKRPVAWISRGKRGQDGSHVRQNADIPIPSPLPPHSFSSSFLFLLCHLNIHQTSPHSLSHFFPGSLWLHGELCHYWWMGEPFVLYEVTKQATMEILCENSFLSEKMPNQQETSRLSSDGSQTGNTPDTKKILLEKWNLIGFEIRDPSKEEGRVRWRIAWKCFQNSSSPLEPSTSSTAIASKILAVSYKNQGKRSVSLPQDIFFKSWEKGLQT